MKVRRPRIALVVGATLFAALAAPAPSLAAPPGAVDAGACVSFDTLGYRYIAFGRTSVAEPGIYLATNRSGTWRVSRHPVAVGLWCAGMIVDGLRHVHLLAVHPLDIDPVSPAELRYVTNKSGTWRSSVVYTGEISFASVAVDRTGLANVGLRDQDGSFLFERSPSGGWIRRRDFAYAGISHMRKDRSGALWVVVDYFDRPRVVRLTDRSGLWTAAAVGVPLLKFANVDLAIDGSGRRYIAIYHSATGRVNVYRSTSGSWALINRTMAYAGRFMAEAESEPSGALHLMFVAPRADGSSAIVDMNRHDGLWHTQLIGYGSFRADIAVDSRGRVAAAFDRGGAVWSYWNDWSGLPHRFNISSL